MTEKYNTDKERIQKILDAIMKVAEGHYDTEIELSDRYDDIDSLIMGVNLMIDDLRTRFEENEAHKAAIKERENMLSDILHNLEDVVASYSLENDTLIYISPSIETLLEHDVQYFYENPRTYWISLFHPKDRPVVQKAEKELRLYGYCEYEGRLVLSDYKIKWVYVRAHYIYEQGLPVKVDSTISDITRRKQHESLLVYKSQLLSSMTQISDQLHRCENLYETLDNCFSILGKTVKVERVYFFENKEHRKTYDPVISQVVEWTSQDALPQQGQPEVENISLKTLGPLADKMKANLPYNEIVSNIKDDELRSYFREQDIKALLVLPVYVSGYFQGLIGLDSCTENRKWSEDEIVILQNLASNIATTIERLKTQRKLQNAKNAADRANNAKSEFLANMSHEIRTPLNSVIGFSDLMMQTPLNAVQKKYIKSVYQSANGLLDIINDILDFSKIEANKMELNKVAVDIKSLAEEVMEVTKYEAVKKGLEHKLNLDSKLPARVMLDPVRIRQILVNLLNNALKFTNTGYVELKIEALGSEDVSKSHLRFSVIDTGIGISDTDQKKIFKSFSQVDTSYTKKYGGSGLGLAISNSLLSLMGSRIRVDSQEGKGSQFYFELSLDVAGTDNEHQDDTDREDDVKDTNSNNEYWPDNPVNILLVEDNPVNMYLARSILLSMDNEIQTLEAENGSQALELFKKYHPDLVLMDIQMPDINGYDVTREIRKLENGKNVPVIALTAGTVKGEKEKCLANGMNDYISKPVVKSTLIEKVREWLLKSDA